MKHLACAGLALVVLLCAPPAQGAFGLNELDVRFENADGSVAAQAGAHPFAMTTTVGFNTKRSEQAGFEVPDGDPRNLRVPQMPGLVGNPSAVPTCATALFLSGDNKCHSSTQVGMMDVTFERPGNEIKTSVFNLEPPPGVAMKLGFHVLVVPVTIEIGVNESLPHNVVASLTNIANPVSVYHSRLKLWGVPAADVHNSERPNVDLPPKPFLTTPRACTGPLETVFEASSWQGQSFLGSVLTHDDAEPPNPQGMVGCGQLAFSPAVEAKPTTKAASSATGMEVAIEVDDEGLTSPDGLAQSDIRKAVITLPEGMTANPSLAEGLEVCTEAQLATETPTSIPGAGCPNASKIGSVEVETPLLEGELLQGSLFMAKPHDNLAADSFLALYLVIKSTDLGIVVRQPVRVEPDPETGQLQGIAEEIPQLPFSRFRVRFREGGRSPLISPPTCGIHTTTAVLTPWAGGPPLTSTSSFEVIAGPNGGPCPSGGLRPFRPGFEAGSLNNQAGAYSPFVLRLTRNDGEQDMTKISAILPPGVVGKLAGIAYCPEAAIAAARAKTGIEERADPSCPESSRIGRTLAGAGVGSQLTYVAGSLYLAGPVGRAPLSVVAVVPAVAGPFDAGTVVVRQALSIDPLTAEVKVDGASSDPIPHILKGIPLNVRDVRVYADRPEFTINPTDCEASATKATLFGSFLAPLDPADDAPVGLSSRYQAANCASLAFAPRLTLKLKGGTKRGAHPALTGTYRPRAGDANLKGLVLRLPRSAFLDQGHIRTICTRVQFAADACPSAAIYGQATAWTPLLAEPLSGPVYLRSSNNKLPDFVADLHGIVDIEAVARIDSVRGGIRTSFEQVPDAPLTKVVVQMQGGVKGLITNSTNLCKGRNRANIAFSAQNGRRQQARPVVTAAGCGKGKRAKRRDGGKRR